MAPPILAMVPRIFAIPSLLVTFTFSSLQFFREGLRERCLHIQKQEGFISRVWNYLKAEAIRKVIAGTEFCIAEANVGDA